MDVNAEGLVHGGYAPSDDGNICIFNGIVTEFPTWWVFRFQDGPAQGDHGPFPMDPPQQFALTMDEGETATQWVLWPCSGGLAKPRDDDGQLRYEMVSMSTLSDVEAQEKQLIRGAQYRIVR